MADEKDKGMVGNGGDAIVNRGRNIDAFVESVAGAGAPAPVVAPAAPEKSSLDMDALYAQAEAKRAAAQAAAAQAQQPAAAAPVQFTPELDQELKDLSRIRDLTPEQSKRSQELLRLKQSAAKNPQASAGPNFTDPQFQHAFNSPNRVMHAIAGPGRKAEMESLFGGPGLAVAGKHPAFPGQDIPPDAGLYEYRIPASNPGLQDRIRSRFQGGVA